MDGKSILITGGTGSFGQAFARYVLKHHTPRRIIVFSRDEFKQYKMRQEFTDPRMRYFLGDVRDYDRLLMAFRPVDIVVHTAALKHVPSGEQNPLEVKKTNVDGASNVIEAAIHSKVERVIALSTDKACAPVNLYGATKFVSDKLFVSANGLSGAGGTTFSVVRYGNVAGSRGSVIPFFREQLSTGILPITHPTMTRFMVTLGDAVRFVVMCLRIMRGGEMFIPKIPSARIWDIARHIGGPQCGYPVTGIRPGEKIHESMITREDARNTLQYKDGFIIQPEQEWYKRKASNVPGDFEYRSDNNSQWLKGQQLARFLDGI
jgi:UDP-N-acetylglucosamine 4,6-dehydratase